MRHNESVQDAPKLESVKAILFDVDGTLIDSIDMVVAGLGDTYEKYSGVRPQDIAIRELIGKPLVDQMHLFGCSPKNNSELEEMMQYTISRYEAHSSLEKEFPHTIDALISCFKAGIKTALVTSRNQQELDELKSSFRGWEFAHEAICASHVTKPKPDPESAVLAMKKLGVKPTETVMIGDSVFDIRCAHGAGLRSGAALYGAGKSEDLLALAPDFVFTHPKDLLDWVSNLIEQQYATEEKHTCRTDF
jgi:pyrophosphatase PpaX